MQLNVPRILLLTSNQLCGRHLAVCFGLFSFTLLLSARTAMWSMPVVLTKWENENDSQNQ